MPAKKKTTHALKCWPEFYGPLRAGRKTFEIRKNDRDFRPNDKLVIREWDPKTGNYTESEPVEATITYLTDFVQVPGYVVLGLSNPRIAELERQLSVARAAFATYLDALEYCHQCGGQLAMDDIDPSHCENCSGDCNSHDEPNCAPIYVLHDRCRKALAQLDAGPGKEG